MSKHTKGPWKSVSMPCLRILPDSPPDNERVLADIGPGWHEDNYAEAVANSKLIASAPELLEASKLVTDHFFYPDNTYEGLEEKTTRLRRVIKKAEGKE